MIFLDMIHEMNISDFIFLIFFSIGVYWLVDKIFRFVEKLL